MTLAEHLRELRARLIRIVIVVTVGAAVGWWLYEPVLELLKAPYCELSRAYRPPSEDTCALIITRPLEGFSVRVKISLVIGLFLAAPFVVHQIWGFIVPGLTSRERRYTLPFVAMSQVMFTVGAGFAYLIIPKGLAILIGLGGDQITPVLTAGEYFSFILTTVLAFALVFEVPLVIILLGAVGVVSAARLRRWRPYAIVINFAVAALVTPTVDVVTMLLMAAPMVVLYEASILVIWLLERARRRRAATSLEGGTPA